MVSEISVADCSIRVARFILKKAEKAGRIGSMVPRSGRWRPDCGWGTAAMRFSTEVRGQRWRVGRPNGVDRRNRESCGRRRTTRARHPAWPPSAAAIGNAGRHRCPRGADRFFFFRNHAHPVPSAVSRWACSHLTVSGDGQNVAVSCPESQRKCWRSLRPRK